MFYSNEFLRSPQHGVATIWLASTVGFDVAGRRISRKAVQEVHIPKACETIMEPQVPLALRLQSNLLFGIARILDKQCDYILSDAEKIRSELKKLAKDDKNLKTGKSKANISIADDPAFDLSLDAQLPAFQVDDEGNVIDPLPLFRRLSSLRLTPLAGDSDFVFNNSSLNSVNQSNRLDNSNAFLEDLDLGLDFGLDLNDPFPKMDAGPSRAAVPPGSRVPVADMSLDPDFRFPETLLDIDPDGTARPHVEQPDLPPLPSPQQQGESSRSAAPLPRRRDEEDDEDMFFANSDEERMAEALREYRVPRHPPMDRIYDEVADPEQEMTARARRARRRIELAPDSVTTISREELKSWEDNYLETQLAITAKREKRARRVPVAVARQNANRFIFGRGVFDVGIPHGTTTSNGRRVPIVNEELASMFSGDALRTAFLGPADPANTVTADIARRRPAENPGMEQGESSRRVKPRLSVEPGQRQQQEGAEIAELARRIEETEIGRDTDMALPDLPSDMPWNRGSSQIPGSSIQAGTRQGSHASASPNTRRVSEIERISSSGGYGDDVAPAPEVPGEDVGMGEGPATSATQALDHDGARFLAIAEAAAREKGVPRADGRVWVAFDDLLGSGERTKEMATQAFFQVLRLATKDLIKVEQANAKSDIRVGIKLTDKFNAAEDADMI